MKQHKVIASLGSNKGNRLQFLQTAIEKIHQKIGTVIDISAVYETPSWGFESEPFYNVSVLFHTYKDPGEVLDLMLAVEQSLGRQRNYSGGYAARTIDMDIIAFDDEIILTQRLQVPHPLLHERRFVLQPSAELNIRWKHPVIGKNFTEMLEECSDPSELKWVSKLKTPFEYKALTKLGFLVIEGNIGIGKTTLTRKIAEDFGMYSLLENFSDNSFLPLYYKNQERYAFALETSFLVDRYHQLQFFDTQKNKKNRGVISDYYFYKSSVFAGFTLEKEELKLFENLFNTLLKQISQPDLYVYLYQKTERLLDNIRKRGRDYEQNISTGYLEKINRAYDAFLHTIPQDRLLKIDVSDLDFVSNPSDYNQIIEMINSKLDS